VVSHGRYVIFQMAEVAIARQMFQEILRLIAMQDRREALTATSTSGNPKRLVEGRSGHFP
jgi:hypothetical protein